jgi:transposase-like protein
VARKGTRYSDEQIVKLLREADQLLDRGMKVAEVCKQIDISLAAYYKWRNRYAGMTQQAAKDLTELRRENARLKRLVADQALRMQILEDGLRGKF